MMDINRLRDLDVRLHGLSGVDAPFTMHYDETNNIRRLHLSPDGLNVREPRCFVLGGIAHPGATPGLELDDLRGLLNLQRSSRELKLEHLGKGDVFDLLNSQRVNALLDWLVREDLFIHYHALDPLYWSIVDIIDSIVDEIGQVELMLVGPALKDDLYSLLRADIPGSAAMLRRYGYPAVGRARRTAFIGELQRLVEAGCNRLPAINHRMLADLLRVAANLDTLPYLEGESPNVLIDCFGAFYLQRLILFKNATHILDIEPAIEKHLASLDLHDGDQPLRNYTFVDSKAEPWVQVADAVSGLLGKLFTYSSKTPIPHIKAALQNLSERQATALANLVALMDRSADHCPALLHYIISAEDHRRRAAMIGF